MSWKKITYVADIFPDGRLCNRVKGTPRDLRGLKGTPRDIRGNKRWRSKGFKHKLIYFIFITCFFFCLIVIVRAFLTLSKQLQQGPEIQCCFPCSTRFDCRINIHELNLQHQVLFRKVEPFRKALVICKSDIDDLKLNIYLVRIIK